MFKRLNEELIEIEEVEDEHEENNDFKPSFWFNNQRYYLEDFVRVHNNPWFVCFDIPEHIHAMELGNYVNPLFIELVGNDEFVAIYADINEEEV